MAPHRIKGERVHGAGELGHVMQLMLPVGRHPGKRWWLRRLLCTRVTVSSSGAAVVGSSSERPFRLARSRDLTRPTFCRTERKKEQKTKKIRKVALDTQTATVEVKKRTETRRLMEQHVPPALSVFKVGGDIRRCRMISISRTVL